MSRPLPCSQFVTFVNTGNLEDAAEFYGSKLGLPLVYEQKGFVLFFQLSGDAFLGVCLRASRAEGDAQGAIPTLVVRTAAEVDAWQTKLEEAGVSVEKRAGHGVSSDGEEQPLVYNLFVRDPAGYLVEVQAFLDAAWPARADSEAELRAELAARDARILEQSKRIAELEALVGSPTAPALAAGSVQVRNLAGAALATLRPVPATVAALKGALEPLLGKPRALQKLVVCGSTTVLEDPELLDPAADLEVCCLHDETPLWAWDLEGNPDAQALEVQGPRLTCPKLQTDYVNVLTREPLRSGRHYIEFVMHNIGDEQWCGLVADAAQAGSRTSGRGLRGWLYYCGRMRSTGSIMDGKGALHAEGRAVVEFEKPRSSGDVIGMLIDFDIGAVAFDLNGRLQGACAVPTGQPLYVLTHVDTPRDDVELRKPSLEDAPPENLESLTKSLIDISSGKRLR